jgi:hypothetical protein
MTMVVELYRLIALNSLPVAHFAVGHSIWIECQARARLRSKVAVRAKSNNSKGMWRLQMEVDLALVIH